MMQSSNFITGTKNLLVNLALAMVSLLFGLILVEAGLRILKVSPLEIKEKSFLPLSAKELRRLMVKPPYTGYYNNIITNQVYYKCRNGDCEEDVRIPFNTNSHGFRDYEYPEEKPEGTIRIVCLGDSFTAGDGVYMEETYPKILESILNERYGELNKFEVINTAVVSYSTAEEWYVLRKWGMRFDPDIVLIGFYLNDSSPSTWRYLELKKAGYQMPPRQLTHYEFPFKNTEIVGQEGRQGMHISNILVTIKYPQKLFLHKWFVSIVNSKRIVRDIKQFYLSLWDDEINEEGLRELAETFNKMGKLQENRSLPFVLAVFPWLQYLDDSYPFEQIHERIDAMCGENNLGTIQLLDNFRALDSSVPLWAHESDHHPSTDLHRIAAEEIADYLVSNRLIPLPDSEHDSEVASVN